MADISSITVLDGTTYNIKDETARNHTHAVESPITFENNTIGFDGYNVSTVTTTLCEESVTTAVQDGGLGSGLLAYSELIDADTITVTFNGTEYECQRIDYNGDYVYGGFSNAGLDFSEYPFVLRSSGYDGNILYTETAGTYTVKIEAIEETITVSSDFAKARGYSVSTGNTTLCDESVTTAVQDSGFVSGLLAYSELIDADTITVTFNGTEYTCQRMSNDGVYSYGGVGAEGPDFSEYPFALVSSDDGNYIFTETAGTYTVKIEAVEKTVSTTEDFEAAVNSVIEDTNTTYEIDRYDIDGNYGISLNGSDGTFSYVQLPDIPTKTSDLTNDSGFITNSSTFMIKGTDYVTAGKKFGSTLGTKATAEGWETTASGTHSHAEGLFVTASGDYSHAEGSGTIASGDDGAHAEGYYTTASGGYGSHAEGNHTTANHRSQHVFGEYNVADDSSATASYRGNYVEIVGNGTSANAASNARTLDWSGNEVLAGKLTVGTAPTANMDVATKQYVDTAVAGVSDSDTTYSISISNNRITLTPSSGTASYIDLPVYNGGVSS